MNRLKKMSALFTVMAMCAFSAVGCGKKAENSKRSVNSEAESSSQSSTAYTVSDINFDSEYFDEDDLDTSCDNPNAEILLNGKNADISGTGAEFKDGKISITKGGTYLFSGTLDDGQIYVNTEDKVHIILNGVNISCTDSSPVYVKKSDKTVITLCDGTDNTFEDSSEYVYENPEDNEPDAVIYSKDDLSVNGGGTLNITANFNEGLTSKDNLRISGITLNVTSVGNSVKGKDSAAFMSTVINAESKGDGLKSSNSQETDKGFVAFESGTFNITAAEDAVQAETDIIVNGGTFNIKTGSSGTNASSPDSQAEMGFPQTGGGRGGMMDSNPNKTEDSEKGLKAGGNIIINDGEITADCSDDTIHSGGGIEINGGIVTLSSGDDGIHADEHIDVNGGDISVVKSYEGIEATVININGGNIHVKSSDDGFNASDGSSGESEFNGGFGGKMGGGFGDVSENCILNINGGYVYVNADGDGLDSNGVMNISGGTVLVDGPVNDGNGALDTGTDINVSGGVLIAAGSSGMAEIPSDNSTQLSIAVSFEQYQDAETLVYVQDENGNTIAAYSPAKTYSSVIISSPDIEKGKSYSVYYGGKCTGTETDGIYSGGNCSGGTLLGTETAESAVTQIGTGKLGTMGGGMVGHGGMKPDGFGRGEISDNQDGMPELPEGMNPHKDFNGDMPDGFDKNMTPPGGFGNGMTPPDGGFGGGMVQGEIGNSITDGEI